MLAVPFFAFIPGNFCKGGRAIREKEWLVYVGLVAAVVAVATVPVMWLTGLPLAGMGLCAGAVAAVAVSLVYDDRARVQRREVEALRSRLDAAGL